MEGKKGNQQCNSNMAPVLKDCATLVDAHPSDSAFTACQPLVGKQVSTLRSFCLPEPIEQ